ncbi:SPOR domain-containing protein, partial [Burkholderia diffusa]
AGVAQPVPGPTLLQEAPAAPAVAAAGASKEAAH